MKKNIRILAALLAALLLLSSCGGDKKETEHSAAPADGSGPVVTMGGQSGETQAPGSDLPDVFELEGQTLLDLCPAEEGWLLVSEGYGTETVEGETESRQVYGTFLTPLNEKLEPGTSERVNEYRPAAVLRAGGSLWVLSDSSEPQGAWVFRDGEPWVRVGDMLDLGQLAWEDGTIYTVLDFRLWIDRREIELPQTGGVRYNVTCVLRAGGQMYALLSGWGNGGSAGHWLCPVDSDTEKLTLPEQTLALPDDAFHACWYGNEAWLVAGSKLYQTDGVTCEEVCDLGALGVDCSFSVLKRLLACPDGSFLAVEPDCVLHVDPRRAGGRTLTMGYLLEDYNCTEDVTAFNRAGTGWRINTRSFSDLETLNLALLNGELDLLYLKDTEILHNYSSKGLLAPIDSAVTDRILPNVVAACSDRGVCCWLSREIHYLNCCSIPAAAVTDPADLRDLDRFAALIDRACPESWECDTKENILRWAMAQCSDSWIDWETRTAHFTDASFLTLLRFADRFENSQEEANANRNGYYKAGIGYFEVFDQVQDNTYGMKVRDDPETGKKAKVLFPFPSADHSGLSMYVSSFYAMVDGDGLSGAKAFFEFLFSETEWYDEPMTNREIYDARWPVQEAHCRALIEKHRALYADGAADPSVSRDLSDWMTLLEQADHIPSMTTTELQSVILEEAQPYFNGDVTAEEAARRIQNRVEIYLAERG